MILNFGFWNQLADGLALGEFLSKEGDEAIIWESRKNAILSTVSALLAECDAIVLAECDHPLWLLEQLRKNGNDIRAVCYLEVPVQDGKPSPVKPSVCRRLHQKRNLGQNETFEQEFSLLGEWTPAKFAGLYNLLPTDADQILLIGAGEKDSFRCDFELNSIEFSIYGAHLSSGEEYSREEILKDASATRNVIVLMDSNNSPQFEKGYGDKLVLSQVIQQMGFHNLIEPEFNECFKMRHCQGGQAAKFGQLMFDCLEKVLVSTKTRGHQLWPHSDAFNYQLYSQDYYEILTALRTDPVKRQALLRHAANIDNVAEASNYIPNPVISSKGDLLFIMDGTAENRWGPKVPTADKLNKLAAELAMDANQLYEILSQLYPNRSSPSDHPPVVVKIEFY